MIFIYISIIASDSFTVLSIKRLISFFLENSENSETMGLNPPQIDDEFRKQFDFPKVIFHFYIVVNI